MASLACSLAGDRSPADVQRGALAPDAGVLAAVGALDADLDRIVASGTAEAVAQVVPPADQTQALA